MKPHRFQKPVGSERKFSKKRFPLSLEVNMTKDQLIEKLRAIVKPYIQDEEAFSNLSENTDFINDLKINSANLVDVVLDVEDEFDIRIENDDMENMTSVKSAMEIINNKLAKK